MADGPREQSLALPCGVDWPPRWPTCACAVLCLATLASTLAPPPMLLLWNASDSSPRGLYVVVPADRYSTGDTVIAWPPPAAAGLAAARGYLPRGVPLVKTVAAGSGDRICAANGRVLINSRPAIARLRLDSAGRRLPQWHGCHVLGRARVLLLGRSHPASFDGRYYGSNDATQIVGRARLLWAA